MGDMTAPQKSNWFGLTPRNDTTYVCKDCGRDVDAELEVSPGEQESLCHDCFDYWDAYQYGIEVPC
jgi:hypothetical protein